MHVMIKFTGKKIKLKSEWKLNQTVKYLSKHGSTSFLSNLLFQSIKKTVHPHSLEVVGTWLKTATDKGSFEFISPNIPLFQQHNLEIQCQ